jgi:hypothetical protein
LGAYGGQIVSRKRLKLIHPGTVAFQYQMSLVSGRTEFSHRNCHPGVVATQDVVRVHHNISNPARVEINDYVFNFANFLVAIVPDVLPDNVARFVHPANLLRIGTGAPRMAAPITRIIPI